MSEPISVLRERLKGRIDFLRGDFTLASGKKSDFYFNGKTTTLRPDALNYAARVFIDMMRKDRPERVGGLTLGADALVGAITAFSFDLGMPMEGFIVRKEPKAHGTGQWIEGPELKAGQRVAVIEDVVTTGGSAVKAIERIRESCPGADIVGVYALVDRLDGGREVLNGLGVKLESVFTKDDLFAARGEKRAAGRGDCLFCRIIRGEIPSTRVYEDDNVLAFRDINPAAPTHVLVVPKRHVDGLGACGEAERELLADVMLAANKAAALENLDSCRVIVNNGAGAGQTVFHLHVHVLGGRDLGERLL